MSSSQYEAEVETARHAHSNSVRALAESRRWAKEALTHAEAKGAPPFQSIVNPEPPTPTDSSSGQSPPWAGALRELHTSVIEYWGELRSYRSEVPELWREGLIKVGYPVPGDWERRSRRYKKDYRQRGIGFEEQAVGLANLGWWRFRQVELLCEYTTTFERQTRTRGRAEKVYLPPAAAQRAFEQMNDVLEELGLAAEVRKNAKGDVDPGTPGDADDWGDVDRR